MFFRKIKSLDRNPSVLENLESRQLLSASAAHAGHVGGGERGRALDAIDFSLAPAKVQSALNDLASTKGLDAPTATQTVRLSNLNGVEIYTLTLSGTGTSSRLSVDQNGNPITTSKTTSTWNAFSGDSANSAAAAEISAIASALSLASPTSTTTVTTVVNSAGSTSYLVTLAPADSGDASTSHRHAHSVTISVDPQGNPVGNQRLPFSVIPGTIQNALNDNAPSGATALSDSSIVNVSTVDGVTLYSATFHSTGVRTTVTVDSAGKLTDLPTRTSTTFDQLADNVQSELQTLATSAGATGTIDSSQSVDVLTEVNGTTLYSVKVSVSSTDSDGDAHAHNLVITVDADGNPTTVPGGRGIGGKHEFLTGNFAGGDFFAGSARRR